MFLIGLLQIECLIKLDDIAFSNIDVVFGDADSNSFTFFSDGIGLNTIDLNNANLDNVNFDEDDPETIIHIRPMACRELRVCNKDIFFYIKHLHVKHKK